MYQDTDTFTFALKNHSSENKRVQAQAAPCHFKENKIARTLVLFIQCLANSKVHPLEQSTSLVLHGQDVREVLYIENVKCERGQKNGQMKKNCYIS